MPNAKCADSRQFCDVSKSVNESLCNITRLVQQRGLVAIAPSKKQLSSISRRRYNDALLDSRIIPSQCKESLLPKLQQTTRNHQHHINGPRHRCCSSIASQQQRIKKERVERLESSKYKNVFNLSEANMALINTDAINESSSTSNTVSSSWLSDVHETDAITLDTFPRTIQHKQQPNKTTTRTTKLEKKRKKERIVDIRPFIPIPWQSSMNLVNIHQVSKRLQIGNRQHSTIASQHTKLKQARSKLSDLTSLSL